MSRVLALPLAVVALAAVPASQAQSEPFQARIERLSPALHKQLTGRFWRPGCPVALSDLRVLTISIYGFDRRVSNGQLIVNRDVAGPLRSVFRQLHAVRFPIRHMRLGDVYGPERARPRDNDISGSFECRRAVPSPCGTGTGNWSNHAYGHAIDLNPRENPYVGCGAVYDPTSRAYVDRTPLRKGMVTPAVVRAFKSIGWGWGGEWSGATKDYMHFSTTGH